MTSTKAARLRTFFAVVALFLSIISVTHTVSLIVLAIRGDYQYQTQIGSNWTLADKSSTLAEKSVYVSKFVTALESSGLQGTHDALFLYTDDNSFDHNLRALKSLSSRLQEIQTLDVNSFAYQTAIQQITDQEQGQANAMLNVLEGCWWKQHHFFLWSFIGFLNILLNVVTLVLAVIAWAMAFKDDY